MKNTPSKPLLALLMNEVDFGFFDRVIKGANLTVPLVRVSSNDDISALCDREGLQIRLIAFCTGVIVPADLIDRLQGNCVNFHPGPPERPGYMPAPFALRDKATDYGVTFHRLAPKVDTGAIIEVSRFPVPDNATQEMLEIEAYKALLHMVMRRITELADVNHRFTASGDEWSGVKTTRKDLAELAKIMEGVSG